MSEGTEIALSTHKQDSDWSVIRKILSAASNTFLMNVSNTLIDTVVFIFIGHEKPIIISALGFGMLWVSAFGIAVVYGIGTGFNTYGSQAFGAKNYPRLGILLHQTLLIMGIIVTVYAVLAFFTSPILHIIGLPEELIVEISKFCKASIFTVLSYGIHQAFCFYLLAQREFKIVALVNWGGFMFQIMNCFFFIRICGFQIVGAALAKCLSYILTSFSMFYYCKKYLPQPSAWVSWSRDSTNIFGMMIPMLTHGAAIYLEWITFELMSLNATLFRDINILAGHSITLNIIYVLFQPTASITLSSSVLLANAVGEGSKSKAKQITKLAVKLLILLGGVMIVLVNNLIDQIGGIYTSDPSVAKILENLLWLYATFGMYPDIFINFLAFQLRTLNEEKFVAKNYILFYYGIGLPLSIILAHYTGLNYYGVWVGVILSMYAFCTTLARKIISIDWDERISLISNEMRKEIELQESFL